MKEYARITSDGNLEFAPINKDGISNWINNEEAVLSSGYYPVVHKEMPVDHCQKGWKLENNEIVPNFEPLSKPKEFEYSKKRAEAYPSIEEQLDMLYWDMINGTSEWTTLISFIKRQYPKPECLQDKN